MKYVTFTLCYIVTLVWGVSIQAQEIKTVPDNVYQDVPFPMEKIRLPEFPDYRVSITDFGAVSSSHIHSTEAINKAIQQVNSQGGGTVVIPAGLWITGPIELLSHVRLHAEKNALVLFSSDHSLYKNPQGGRTLSPIYANNAVDIAITGEGIFDGNGNTWRMVKRSKMTEGQWKGLLGKGGVVTPDGNMWYPNEILAQKDIRPNMIRLWECKNILLQGITFRNSPAWCVHPIHCEELTIHGVSVFNPWYSQNGDALDIESCNRVLIYDCTIDAGDDAICIKSGKDEPGRKRGWPCQNVIARNNVVYHGHGGFVVGSEMSGGVNNIFIDNCTFVGTDVGIRFKSTRGRGGVVENIFCRRINMFEIANDNILFDLYYGIKGADISKKEPVSEETPIFRNIQITDVKGIGGKRAMYFNGLPEMKIQNIKMENISFTNTQEGAVIRQADHIMMENVVISSLDGKPLVLQDASNVVINGKKVDGSPIRVHIIGDSTMADYVENTTRTRGWGEMLQEFFSSGVEIVNYARGGRSSHSFYKEGRWKLVTDSLKYGDYVFIQFAHNDEKEGGKDGADGRGTAPWTTYKKYMEKYVDETRALGATPVLVTPIIRRYFMEDGTISPKGCHDLSIAPDDSTLNYVRVMKQVARNKQVQLVDMTAITKEYAEYLGAERTIKCIYVPTDGTHTQATGAACYARLAVEELKKQGILADYIRQDIPLVLNPTSLDFKTLFVGEKGTVCFDLTGLNLNPEAGELTIKAPEGMTIADDPHGTPQQALTYNYQHGELWNKCLYLYFTPSQSGVVESHVTISYGDQQRLLPVKADVKEVLERVSVEYTLENPSLRELKEESQGITMESGQWTAEIDEAQKRYVEIILPRSEQTLLLRQLSFTLEGEIAYRVACAYGKDFYPRTDLGEAQQPVSDVQKLTFPMNITLNPRQQLHIRLFPWSTRGTDKLHFKVSDWKIEGISLK